MARRGGAVRYALGLLILSAVASSAEPGANVGGTVHPVAGPAVASGTVLFEDGVIVAVGPAGAVEVPPAATVVDATGKHVWPSMIDMNTSLGLTEIGSVRGTVDTNEIGGMNPNARAEVSLNVSSSHLPVTRANGVLLAATLPRGGVVPGTAALIALDGWSWEELVRKAPLGLVIEWPRMDPRKSIAPAKWTEETADKPLAWEVAIARLDEMMEEAGAYARARAAGTPDRDADVRWESLASVVSGDTPVWVEAASLAQIRAALDWTQKHGLRMVLLDGNGSVSGDAWRVAEELAARSVPVICRTTRRPPRRWEPYDTCYTGPARLHEAGVAVAFGTRSASNARNLPAEAARAAAYGLPREIAERGLTLTAAEIAGVADRYGSLEAGKSATLLIVDGDLLETRMNVERAWLDGKEVDLESRHTRLWKQWSSRPMPDVADE